MSTVNTNAGTERTRWIRGLPAPVRDLCRPLLQKGWEFYRSSAEKLREGLTAPSVTSYLMGGCANQIFQYATGLALARRLGVELRLDVSWYETATPRTPRLYSLGLFKGVDARVVMNLSGQVVREEGFPYNPALFESARRRCSL